MERMVYIVEAITHNEVEEVFGMTFDLEKARHTAREMVQSRNIPHQLSGYRICAKDISAAFLDDALFDDPKRLFLAWFRSSSELADPVIIEIFKGTEVYQYVLEQPLLRYDPQSRTSHTVGDYSVLSGDITYRKEQ